MTEDEYISKEEIEEFAKIHKRYYLSIDINDISNLQESIKNAIKNIIEN